MSSKSPRDAAQKWVRNLSGSVESIKSGVQALTVSPTESAARQADAYAAGVARAIADGKYQAGLRRVSLEDWKNAVLTKGVQRIASGATNAVGKVEQFLTDFLPHIDAGKRMLEGMPRGDLEANLARMTAMARHNAKFRRSR